MPLTMLCLLAACDDGWVVWVGTWDGDGECGGGTGNLVLSGTDCFPLSLSRGGLGVVVACEPPAVE